MRQTTNKNLTKQILTLALAFVMVFTGMGIGSWGVDTAWADETVTQAAEPWDGKTQTPVEPNSDGVYEISTGAELAWFAAQVKASQNTNANIKLTTDIDLGGNEWTPIGGFYHYGGTFDGQGYTIRNIKISTHGRYIGFFDYTSNAVIKNVILEGNISIEEPKNYSGSMPIYYGGLVGHAVDGEFINCTSYMNITISGASDKTGRRALGGLFGRLYKEAKAIACQNYGNITYNANFLQKNQQVGIGGIAGEVSGAVIDSAHNSGKICANIGETGQAWCGGIIGWLKKAGNLNNAYNIGTVKSSSNGTDTILTEGSLVGNFDGTQGYPTNVTYQQGDGTVGLYDKNGDAIADSRSGACAKTTEYLQLEDFLTQCNQTKAITKYEIVWEKDKKSGYPKIKSAMRINSAPTFLSGVPATVETSIEVGEEYSVNLTLIFYDEDGDPITYTVKANDAETVATTSPYVFIGKQTGKTTLVFNASDGKLQSAPYTVVLDVRAPAFGGTGTKEDPYTIGDATAFKDFSEKYNKKPEQYKNKYWKQTAEIDMKGVTFAPIGEETAFSGFYDGGKFAIKNLTISSGATEVGLFGSVAETDDGGSSLKNIILDENCRISGSAEGCSIGAIAGTLTGESIIENCVNKAAVTSSAPAGFNAKASHAGGIVGSLASNSKVLNSKNYGTVSQTVAHNWYAGGIAGKQSPASIVAGCENHGIVSAASSAGYGGPGTGSVAGGITAYSYGGYISGCYNDGNVLAGKYAGGIVGKADGGSAYNGIIESCYNLGSVKGNASDADALLGGIVGSLSWTKLNNCYHAGTVTANSEASNTKKGAIMGQSLFMREVKGNYFLGTALSEAYGSMGIGDTAKKSNFSPKDEDEMKGGELLTLLKSYTEPYSLYLANWTADKNNSNQGYPKFSKVEKIQSHFAEMKSFTVTIDGTEYKGVISGTDIDIVLPAETTKITPEMTVSDQATVTPASEVEVTLQDGTAQFTVTAENGINKQVYTLHATVPEEASGLAALKLTSYPDEILAASAFSQQQKDYPIALSDSKVVGKTLIISAIPATSGATMSAKLNDGEAVDLTAASSLSESSGSIELWKSGAQTQPVHVGANTLTITVTPAGGEATVYTINIKVQPTLSALSVKNGEEELAFHKAFDGDVTAYSLDVWDNVKSLTLSAKERMTGIAQVTLPAEASEDGILDITKLDSFTVQVGDAQESTTYTVTLNKKATFKAEIAVTPKDAIVVVLDAAGKTMQPNADGSYTLAKEETYTVRAAKAGYRTIEKTFTETSLKDGKLTLSLNDTSSSLPSFTGDWTSFRGSDTNNGVTAAKTPKTANAAKELWAVKLGTGYANAPTPQLLINGHLYLQSGKKLYILDPKTGDTLKSTTLMGSSFYTTNPVAYGGGMIFVSIDDGNDSYIQALNAETLESLWVSEKVSGQLITPVTYHNGYLYTGTWNGEKQTGTYYMLSATDEDTAKPDETKKVLWKLDHKGGFYWAGAYATDKYVVFGSDDGTGESNAESAVLYSVNPLNGAVISKITGLKGDIRSSITYQDGCVYFTTKGGMLYRVAIDENGTLGEVKSFDMGYMGTGTPVISDGVVFVSRSGEGVDQFNCIGAAYAIDAKTMGKIAEVEIDGYIQSSMLLTTAYKESDKALYLYATYNKKPGGMLVIEYDLANKTLTKEALYTPTGDKVEYNICSPVCDADGNIYFKNDSGYIFAIGARAADEKQIATVNFVLNGGSAIGISEGSAKTYYSSDEGQTLPIPSKSGYTFKGWFSENNNTSQTSKQYTQVSAGLPDTLYAIWEEVKKPTQEDGNIKVTFRLIGAEQAKQAVDLSKNTYLPNYVTWISTKSYTVKAGTTVGEVFKKALGEAGIDYHGYERNYINEIKAPTSLGGYWLGEFDNGRKSGWMYTVNGTHPNKGLVEWTLNNGDNIVWHYVNDYSFEVADWFPDPDYPSLAKDARYYNGWLKASDTVGSSGGGAAAGAVEEEVKKEVTTSGASGSAATSAPTEVKVTEKKNADGTKETVAESKVSTDNQKEILKQAAEKKSAEIILEVSKTDSKGADSVQLSLEVSFVKNVADKTDADLSVNTENGKVTLDQETIKTVLAETKGATITLEVSKVSKPTEVQKKAAGANGHLLKLTIKSGDKVISDFNKGKVKVVAEIVSKLLDKKVAAIHIADDGKIEQLAGKVLTIGGKKYYEFTTPHFSTFALIDAEELGLEVKDEPQTDVKALTAKLTPVARSAKTAKKNVKVTVSLDKQDKAIIKELKDAGYTVKYRFYRSTKKAAGYKAAVTKKTASYTNASGKKGKKYYYKVQVRVYDANGKLAAKTALKQCKYAARTWTK